MSFKDRLCRINPAVAAIGLLMWHFNLGGLAPSQLPASQTTLPVNREEAFFDSHPWLDSDCEDDFYSVHGDFTPSRGNTPCLSRTTSERIVSTAKDSSPAEKKKKLLELFQDSAHYDHSNDDQKMGNSDVETKSTSVHDFPPKSADATPYVCGSSSVCSSGRTVDGDSTAAVRDKSVPCCLPSLVSCRSFSERRKKTNPVITIDGKSLI